MTATEWSAPGSVPEPPVRSTVTPDPVPGDPVRAAGVARARGDDPLPLDRPEGLGADQPLADLRPVGVLAVLDGGFAMLRFRFGRLVALAAIVVLPLTAGELVVALRSPQVPAVDPLSTPSAFEALAASSSSSAWAVLFAVLGAVGTTWIGLAVGAAAAAWIAGDDPTWSELVVGALRRAWVAPVLTLVTLSIKLPAACLLGVGFLAADAFVFTAAVIAGGERIGPFAAVGRAFDLSRRSYGRALGICVGGLAITVVLQFVVLLGPFTLVSSFGVGGTVATVVSQAAGLVVLVTVPLTACIAARAWIDLRSRAEGVDLLARATERGLG